AIATCVTLPEPDPDQELMLEALSQAGLDVSLAPWDDDTIDWASYDLAVIRSTWNYHEHLDAFKSWLDRASESTLLINPAPIVRWNLHKGYLRELEQAGLPIVPTAFVDANEPTDLASILNDRGWADVVIKPCVSAGSARTRRFADGFKPEAADFLASITATDDAMIQPFIPSVEDGGERSAIWIAGETTHAIVKQPRFDSDDESVSDAKPITDAESDMLATCLDTVGEGLLYARLDTMRSTDGSLLISELELIEPSLFLLQSEAATRRFAEAIASLAGI
ncbi:MAG: hypothetical protein AAFS11_10190, partial [Planctomycetota bacterium]